jgi:hypothetical protein
MICVQEKIYIAIFLIIKNKKLKGGLSMFTKEDMEKLKREIGIFLEKFMVIVEMLDIIPRIDFEIGKYNLTIYKVSDIIRIDIKTKTL